MTDLELAQDDDLPASPSDAELHDPASPTMFDISPLYCSWNDCTQGFWELEEMVQHLHDVHIKPQPAKKPTCEWQDCPRKSKPQTSKFALLAHLRSHTGEKPFICPRPECDRSFTRTDALQKHMRVQHLENLAPSRKPPTKKSKSEPEALAELDASDSNPYGFQGETLDAAYSMFDPALLATGEPVPSAAIASGSATPSSTQLIPSMSSARVASYPVLAPIEQEESDSPEMSQAISAHPEMLPDQVRYLCMLARHRYAYQERDSLLAELDSLSKIKHRLFVQKDALIDTIVGAQIGSEAVELLQPITNAEIPPLKWRLANRTSLDGIGVRDVKAEQLAASGVVDDDED